MTDEKRLVGFLDPNGNELFVVKKSHRWSFWDTYVAMTGTESGSESQNVMTMRFKNPPCKPFISLFPIAPSLDPHFSSHDPFRLINIYIYFSSQSNAD